MSVVNIYHKTRDIIYELNWPEETEIDVSFEAETNSVIYSENLDNVASYTINGEIPSFPYNIDKGIAYSVSIQKTDSLSSAKILFNSRIESEIKIKKNAPTLLSESVQGTKQYFIHFADKKVSIIDSSLINETNYLGGTDYTTSPIIATINLPSTTGTEEWDDLFYDYINDRMILVGRDITTDGLQFMLASLYISGTKENQIWNLDGTVKDSYDIFYGDTQGGTRIKAAVDFNDGLVILRGNRVYFGSLHDLNSWEYDTSNFLLLRNTELTPKNQFNSYYDSFIVDTCFQNPHDYSRRFNFYRTDASHYTCDNINNYAFSFNYVGINGMYVFSGNNQLSYISGINCYRPTLTIPASVKRRMLVTKNHTYNNYPRVASLINLETNTLIRNEEVFTDIDVTTVKDAEYINSIECFACLSAGTEATQGERLIYYLDANNDGITSMLKYKLLLNFDTDRVETNRIRY